MPLDNKMKLKNINIPTHKIELFCQKWQISELSLFGSVLRDDFNSNSDIDILVTFAPNAKRGLTETIQMRDELETLFQRPVDLIVKDAIQRSDNWLRKKNILDSAQTIYVKRSRITN